MKNYSPRILRRNQPQAYCAASDVHRPRLSESAVIPSRPEPPPAFFAAVSRAVVRRSETGSNVEAAKSNLPPAEFEIGMPNVEIDCVLLDIRVRLRGVMSRPMLWTAVDRFSRALIATHVELAGEHGGRPHSDPARN